MDYEVPLAKITTKGEDFNSASSNIASKVDSLTSSLSSYSGSEIGSIVGDIKNKLERLKTGFSETASWISEYCTTLSELESQLTNFKETLAEPFLGEFENVFYAITAPTLSGGSEERNANIVTDDHDLLGKVDTARIPNNGCKMKIPYYSQNEGEWSGLQFGDGNIGSSGCSISSIAMVMSYLKKGNITPADVRQMIADNNNGNYNAYMVEAGASWSIFPAVADYYNVSCNQLSRDSVRTALQNGTPVIMSAGPGDFTTSGHFIVLTGIDDQGNITLNDPNGRHTSYSDRTWNLDYVLNQGKGWWQFSQ